MSKLMQKVESFLTKDDWSFKRVEGKHAFTFSVSDEISITCFIIVDEQQSLLRSYAVCPNKIPESKRKEMSECLVRMNYGLLVGYFEMDLDDGEVRFKSSIPFLDEDVEESMLKNMIYLPPFMMNRYYPALMRIVFGDMSPLQALSQIAADGEEEAPLHASMIDC